MLRFAIEDGGVIWVRPDDIVLIGTHQGRIYLRLRHLDKAIPLCEERTEDEILDTLREWYEVKDSQGR